MVVGMSGSPLLSVVVPVYRVEAYVASCLDSLLSDEGAGDDLEVVAVHDHSPDSCGEILAWYASRDQRVRVVHLPTNVGLGRARNAGLNAARGDHVWFVDGDDWLPAGSVTAVLARLRLHRPDVLIVDHVETFPDGREAPGTPAGALVGRGDPGPLADHPHLLSNTRPAAGTAASTAGSASHPEASSIAVLAVC